MLKPTGNRLIVTEQLETLSSVIQIPDTVRKEREQLCTVVAVGPKVKDIVPGSKILAAIWGGTPVEHEGTTLRMIDDGSVLAIFEQSECLSQGRVTRRMPSPRSNRDCISPLPEQALPWD